MSKIFFFTNPNLLLPQTRTDAYGPVIGFENSKFQVTSLHTSIEDPIAYAVLDGKIVAVPTNNPNLITIIIKPSLQVQNVLGINFVPIKYIIYKGILKTSVIATDSSLDDTIAERETNDLTEKVWAIQDLLNAASGNNDKPSSNLLRFANSFSGTSSIDNLFYSFSGGFYESPSVNAGETIGSFDKNHFGIEFIFDDLRSDPKMNELLNLATIIEVPVETTTPTLLEKFQIRNLKEKILNYMDPAAFYGSLYPAAVGNVVYVNLNSTAEEIVTLEEADLLYKNLLANPITPLDHSTSFFINKNRVYIDIRNEYGRSFNYMNNYSDNIKLTLGGSDITDVNYYNDSVRGYFSWPILSIDRSYFVSSTEVLNYKGNTNKNLVKIDLVLPCTDNENPSPKIFITQGFIDLGSRRARKTSIKLEKDFNLVTGSQRFINVEKTRTEDYLDPIELINQNWTDGSSTPITPIASYIKLSLLKEVNKLLSSDIVHRSESFIDNHFILNHLKPLLAAPSKLRSKVYYTNSFFGVNADFTGIINDVVPKSPELPFVANIGIAEDTQNITLFAFADTLLVDSKDPSINLVSQLDDSEHFLNFVNESHPDTILARGNLLLPGNQNEKYLIFNNPDVTGDPVFFKNIAKLHNEFIAIVLKKATFNSLISNSTLNTNYDIHLVLRNRITGVDLTESAAKKGLPYTGYELHLRGYQEDTTNNIIYGAEEFTGIVVYGFGHDRSLILKEEGADISPGTEGDQYLPCLKKRISDEIDTQMINGLIPSYGSQFNRLLSLIIRLNSANDFRPNKDLYDFVFNPANTGFTISLNPTLNVDDVGIPKFTSLPSKGWIAEACAIFAMWDLSCQVQYFSGKADVGALIPDILNRFEKIVIRNGAILPGYIVSESISQSKKEIFYLLSPNENYMHYIGGNSESLNLGYTNSKYKDNIRINLAEFIGNGNFNLIDNFLESKRPSKKRFNLPLIPSNKESQLKLINTISGRILKQMTTEFSYLIGRDFRCLWNIFTRNTVYDNLPIPQCVYLASGEGSNTNGLTNFKVIPKVVSGEIPENTNFGVPLFTYRYDNNGNILEKATANFKSFDKNHKTVLHLTIFGLNENDKPDPLSNGLQTGYIDIEITNKIGGRYICRLSADNNSIEFERKLFAQHSLKLSDYSSVPDSHLISYKAIENCSDYGTSLNIIGGTTESSINSSAVFVDKEGKSIAIFDPVNNDLIIEIPTPYDIKVELNSGPEILTSSGVTSIISYDETQLLVCAFQGDEREQPIIIHAEDVYENDKFELTIEQKRKLLMKSDGDPINPVFSNDPELIYSYAVLIELMLSSPTFELAINMTPNNIGKLRDATKSINSPKTERDSNYLFGRPRFEKYASDNGISFNEPVPTQENVEIFLDFSPQDIKKEGRLLEVPAWLDEIKMGRLRYSFAKINLVESGDLKKLFIDIESTVSPRWSRLDEKVLTLSDNGLGSSNLIELNKKTHYLAEPVPSPNNRDSFIKWNPSSAVQQQGQYTYTSYPPPPPLLGEDPDYTAYPSYNPVLSALRCFGLMEAIKDNFVYIATDLLGKTPTEVNTIATKIQQSIDAVVINPVTEIGLMETVTYSDYEAYKWYHNPSDKALYVPVI